MPPAPPTIDSTLGAVFVGFALSCGVYGVLTSQIFSYFRNYPGDKLHFKLLVSIPAYMHFNGTENKLSGCGNTVSILATMPTHFTCPRATQIIGDRRPMLHWTSRVLLLHLQLLQPDRPAASDYDLVRYLYPSLSRRV